MVNDDGHTASEHHKPEALRTSTAVGQRALRAQDRHRGEGQLVVVRSEAADTARVRAAPVGTASALSEIGATVRYQIRIQGHLDNTWSEWFHGLAIVNLGDGVTMLEGDLVDQPALHGVLHRIRDLGLPLLAVVQVTEYGAGGEP